MHTTGVEEISGPFRATFLPLCLDDPPHLCQYGMAYRRAYGLYDSGLSRNPFVARYVGILLCQMYESFSDSEMKHHTFLNLDSGSLLPVSGDLVELTCS